jgi:Helix-turn-helix domain of resolvase
MLTSSILTALAVALLWLRRHLLQSPPQSQKNPERRSTEGKSRDDGEPPEPDMLRAEQTAIHGALKEIAAQGRERAKRRGVRFGRKPKLTSQQQRDLLRRLDEGEETRTELARGYNVHPSTISRLAGSKHYPIEDTPK